MDSREIIHLPNFGRIRSKNCSIRRPSINLCPSQIFDYVPLQCAVSVIDLLLLLGSQMKFLHTMLRIKHKFACHHTPTSHLFLTPQPSLTHFSPVSHPSLTYQSPISHHIHTHLTPISSPIHTRHPRSWTKFNFSLVLRSAKMQCFANHFTSLWIAAFTCDQKS